jgi:pyrimidine operon attenuation protein / uracil phosphoribosyltransferase
VSRTLPDAEKLLEIVATQLKPLINKDTALVGIKSGGAWMVERLIPMLNLSIPHGTLDISFYRDDYNKRGLNTENTPSKIAFEVENRQIILVDDIFYTGRTIRAAMNELFDYGRPASISLAVLINRGGRELPICPQICAYEATFSPEDNIQLLRRENGHFYLSLEQKK